MTNKVRSVLGESVEGEILKVTQQMLILLSNQDGLRYLIKLDELYINMRKGFGCQKYKLKL